MVSTFEDFYSAVPTIRADTPFMVTDGTTEYLIDSLELVLDEDGAVSYCQVNISAKA